MLIPLLSSFGSSINLICIIGLLAVISGFILKKLHQPNLIAYILIGVIVGNNGFALIENEESIRFIGDLGIILLFFFIGMEIDLSSFIKEWKLAFFGTITQIGLSIVSVLAVGVLFDWPLVRGIVLGCVIALSSSAVIFKLLEDKQLLKKKIGKNVTSILLAQDIAIAPILISIAVLGGVQESAWSTYLKIIGGIILIGIIVYIYIKKEIRLPFKEQIKKDHESQVFLALFFCFAGALLANTFGLSEALGAFVGGLVMHAGKATKWIHDAIHSFRILFVAIFFISIGAQINLVFIGENWAELIAVLTAVYFTNHLINSLILRFYNNTWNQAIIGGALLAQIGELSFLICMTAYNINILTSYTYDFTIALISLTICISPLYILLTERVVSRFSTTIVNDNIKPNSIS